MISQVDLEAINAAHQAATLTCDGLPGTQADLEAFYRKAYSSWPAVYAEMLALRDKVAELEELLEDTKNQRDGALYFMERNDIFNEDEVAARDARMRREGAIEHLTRIANEECRTVFKSDLPHITRIALLDEIETLKGGE